MDFGSGPRRILAIPKKNFMSTYVDFLIYDSHESISFVEFSPLNSLWFPTTTESRCFDVPAHLNLCAHLCWAADAAHPSGVIQPKVESHLLIEGVSLLCFRETYEKLIPCDQNSPPLALIWGDEWFIRYLHSFWYTTIVTHLSSVNIWQIICSMLQTSQNLNLQFIFLSTWTKCLRHLLSIFYDSLWY